MNEMNAIIINDDAAPCVYCLYCDEFNICDAYGQLKMCRLSDCPSDCIPCKGYSWNAKE